MSLKRLKSLKYLMVILALASSASGEPSPEKLNLVGHARKNGKDLYVERTKSTLKNGKIDTTNTQFVSPDGKLLAEMKSKSSIHPYLPDIEFNDSRDGYSYTVRTVVQGEIEIRIKESTNDEWVTKPLVKFKKDMIVIQSILDFAHDHIDDIVKGEKIVASFLIPSKATDYAMRIGLAHAGKVSALNDKVVDLTVESNNWVLRNTKVFPPINLTYDSGHHRLRKFSGISTIMAELGTIEVDFD